MRFIALCILALSLHCSPALNAQGWTTAKSGPIVGEVLPDMTWERRRRKSIFA